MERHRLIMPCQEKMAYRKFVSGKHGLGTMMCYSLLNEKRGKTTSEFIELIKKQAFIKLFLTNTFLD